ncbi:lactate permease [Neisseria sp. HSC-16F19]|nr:L-lactate permease [Neisseria sp. HSC-16F19]MCP2041230.1 lactate permease [Neisseria sp. HSC-16F19]
MLVLLSLPLVLVLVLIVGFKLSGVRAGLAGIALAVALALGLEGLEFNARIAYQAGVNALILTLMGMAVIFSGLLFNDILSKGRFSARLQDYIFHLPMPLAIKAFLLIFGLLPALEALTGFGVSLLLGVPLLMTLFDKQTGLRLSMLGMNVIPWGTMALATLVGAGLIGVDAVLLGVETAYLAACVALGFALIAMVVLGGFLKMRQGQSLGQTDNSFTAAFWSKNARFCVGNARKVSNLAALSALNRTLLPKKSATRPNCQFALGISALAGVLTAGCFGGLLMAFNHLGLTETAGVLAGGTVFIAGFLLCGAVYGFQRLGSPLRLIQNLAPYLLVVGLVLTVKWLVAVFATDSTAFTLTGFVVVFNVLKSPAIALLAASAAVCLWLNNKHTPIRVDWPVGKTLKSCSGLFVFVLLAQILNFSGFLQGIVAVLAGMDNPLLLKLLSPLLAIVSGFVTGSNTSANALLIQMQYDLGALSGDGVLFAAIQNAGSGLATFSSMPIIILMMTIAQGVREDMEAADEAALLKFGLKCLGVVYAALLMGVWCLS